MCLGTLHSMWSLKEVGEMCDVADPAGHGMNHLVVPGLGAIGKEGKLLPECQSEGKVKNGRLEFMWYVWGKTRSWEVKVLQRAISYHICIFFKLYSFIYFINYYDFLIISQASWILNLCFQKQKTRWWTKYLFYKIWKIFAY